MLEIARSSPGECDHALPHALWFLTATSKGLVKLRYFPRAVAEERLGSTNLSGYWLELGEAPVIIKRAHLQPKRVDLFLNWIFCRLKFGDRCFLFSVPTPK
jgi:hypothetical protein